ncbi:MAG: CsbD family protein [Actinobacteria bacterium]|nr:CsbD family protein [Actinomycetota bacterium]
MGESGTKAGLKGVVEDVKGKAKQVAGEVSGNDDLEREGRAQQDKATNERDVAEHEAKAEASRAGAEADEARQRAAERAK